MLGRGGQRVVFAAWTADLWPRMAVEQVLPGRGGLDSLTMPGDIEDEDEDEDEDGMFGME
ncbi:hypothetical protein Dda_3103 [Drechslerella dactyloides]|uniref:Uncharacterized protein n=1 Tax=Drechslerella dactyloides TaxID=74499 RepID=A0AAD6J1A6_DREDA|nr:hypothetical protein Dda_3103 [Drechslerella dactyloides]